MTLFSATLSSVITKLILQVLNGWFSIDLLVKLTLELEKELEVLKESDPLGNYCNRDYLLDTVDHKLPKSRAIK